MTDFLLEILSEEIPAKMQKTIAQNFADIAFEALLKAGLQLTKNQVHCWIAPRRLTLFVANLAKEQKISAQKRVGPKVTADKKAIDGFLRSCGLTSENELAQIEHNGALCFVYQKPESSIKTAQILQENTPIMLQKITNCWPKLMRFNIDERNGQAKWIRPVRNVLCMFGDEIINIEFAELKSTNHTYGHFLHSDKPIEIKLASSYKNILQENFVLVDQEERKNKIITQVNKIKFEQNLETVDNANSAIFDEVIGLCEWPTALLASIDEKFQKLPDEVLILTLKLNQKYLCLKDANGNLSTKFIFISNALNGANKSSKIISDNEKVVRARLSDAQFYVDEDLKKPLASRLYDLKTVTFHQKIGSVFDRVDRIENIAELLAVWIAHCDIALVEKAAILCKADLTTNAVAELPELQGKIGSFYASLQGEGNKISAAIYEHYLPLGPNSVLPKTPLGIALAIADKIDLIVSMFLANEKPTSSKDPFALRRAALGIIRIIFTYNINFPIKILVEKSLRLYKPKLLEKLLKEQSITKQKLTEEIISFFFERLKNFLKENNKISAEVVNAVVDDYMQNLQKKKYCDILLIIKKADFVERVSKNKEYENILQLHKRCTNVLTIEEKKDQKKYRKKPSLLALKNEHEKNLYQAVKKIEHNFYKFARSNNFDEAFLLLKNLQAPLENFFDNVIVNDNNKKTRETRLLLLAQICALFDKITDFSKI